MRSTNHGRFLAASALLTSLVLVGGGCMSSSNPGSPSPEPSAAVNAPVGVPNGTNGSAAANTNGAAPGAPGTAAPRTATITLKGIKGGDVQYGSVTLTDLPGNSTRVDITLSGDRSSSTQPAAIYAGTCATQQAEVQYPLNPVVNGRSSTTLAVNIGAILDKAPQALKVREDGTTPDLPFAACGDLK